MSRGKIGNDHSAPSFAAMERKPEMVRYPWPWPSYYQNLHDSSQVPWQNSYVTLKVSYYQNSYDSSEVPPQEKALEAKEASGTTARSSHDSQVTFADLREADKPAEDEPMNVESDSSDGDSTETEVPEHGASLRDLGSYVVLFFFDLVNHSPPSTMIAEEPFTTQEIAREAEKRVGPIPVQFFTNNRRPLHVDDLLAHRVVLWVYRMDDRDIDRIPGARAGARGAGAPCEGGRHGPEQGC